MTKKLFSRSLLIAVVAILLIASTTLACSYGLHLNASSNDCETISASGYASASDRNVKLMAELYVDGNLKDTEVYTTTGSDKTANVSWSGAASPGNHTVLIIGYKWEQTGSETYTYEKTGDYSGSRVYINFKDGDRKIDIIGQNGYVVTGVWMKVENDGQSGYVYKGSGNFYNYDPYGRDIEQVKVTVSKAIYGFVEFDRTDKDVPVDTCLVQGFKAHQAYLEDECAGIKRVVNLYEGPPGNPYQTLLGTHYNVTIPFTNPFALETIPGDSIALPAGFGGPAVFAPMAEPANCQVPHETEAWYEKDCDGWKVGYKLDGEITVTKTGTWGNPYGPEHIAEVVEVPIPEGELGTKMLWIDFDKDIDCISCETHVDHYLAEVHPATEPTIPLMTNPQGQPFCAVAVPGEGVEPDLGRVAMACSKCLDQVDGGYIFVGEPGAVGEAVVWNRCWSPEEGYKVFYTWQGRYWKPGPDDVEKFTPTGRNPDCPRIEGCSDWIREQVPELFPAPPEE